MSSRRLSPSWLLLIGLLSSCDSSRAASGSESFSRKMRSYEDDTVPAAPVVSADKTVRPDVLVVPFGFRQEAESPEKAVAQLKSAVDGYMRAAVEATKAEVALQMQNLQEVPASRASSEQPRYAMVVQGALRVVLPETLDFWGRSTLVAELLQVGHQTQAAMAAAKDSGLSFTFYEPSAQVKDPEAHRADLMKRWVARSRSLVSEAQHEGAPLQLVGCTPPGRVEQRPVTLEEVALTLTVTCQLQVGPQAGPATATAAK